jgi:hypothetical protein
MTNKAEIYHYCINKNTPQDFILNVLLGQNITDNEFPKYYVKLFEMDVSSKDLSTEKLQYEYLESLFELFNSEANPLASADTIHGIKKL